MQQRSKITLILFLLLLLGSSLVRGQNLWTATLSSTPKKVLEKENLPLFVMLLNTPVYLDLKNKNFYYYVPFLRALHFDQVASTLLLNMVKIDNVFKAYNAMNQMQSVEEVVPEHILNRPLIVSKKESLASKKNTIKKDRKILSSRLQQISKDITIAKIKLNSALGKENHRMIDYHKNYLIEREMKWQKEKLEGENKIGEAIANLEQSEQELDELIDKEKETWRRRRLYGIVSHLAFAGISIDITKYSTTKSLVAAINNAMVPARTRPRAFFKQNRPCFTLEPAPRT